MGKLLTFNKHKDSEIIIIKYNVVKVLKVDIFKCFQTLNRSTGSRQTV